MTQKSHFTQVGVPQEHGHTFILVNEPQHKKHHYTAKATMEKQQRIPPCLGNEDGCSEDPTSISHLYTLSDKDFKEKMLRMFKELQEIMEQTLKKI